MNAALQGFGLSLGDPTIVAEELESGALVAPFAPVLETDHEYALIARPDSQRHGVERVCHWLLAGGRPALTGQKKRQPRGRGCFVG